MSELSSASAKRDAKDVMEAILQHVGMKAPTFAKTIGVTYQRIFDVTNGRTKTLSPALINAICSKYTDINKSFLYTGEGELFIEQTEQKTSEQIQASDMMEMSKQFLSLFQSLTEKEARLQERIEELNRRERELIEREQYLAEREIEVTRRESEVGIKKSVPA